MDCSEQIGNNKNMSNWDLHQPFTIKSMRFCLFLPSKLTSSAWYCSEHLFLAVEKSPLKGRVPKDCPLRPGSANEPRRGYLQLGHMHQWPKHWSIDILVGGWPILLKNMKVSWDDYSMIIPSNYMEKCSKPPTRMGLLIMRKPQGNTLWNTRENPWENPVSIFLFNNPLTNGGVFGTWFMR